MCVLVWYSWTRKHKAGQGHGLITAHTDLEESCMGFCPALLGWMGHCSVWPVCIAARLWRGRPSSGAASRRSQPQHLCFQQPEPVLCCVEPICCQLIIYFTMCCQMQKWANIGELGPMRCDKLFAYQVKENLRYPGLCCWQTNMLILHDMVSVRR